MRAVYCSVLEFGPVPTPPTPLFQGAPVRLLAPKGVPPLRVKIVDITSESARTTVQRNPIACSHPRRQVILYVVSARREAFDDKYTR